MKLLLIDYLSPQGHIKFDRIHIKSLQKDNVLDVVGKKGHFKDFEDYPGVNIGTIPDSLFTKLPFKPFTERLLGLLRILWICCNYNDECYDAVIFLSYDILSLFVYRKKDKIYLINHNNVSQLSNRIKLYLTRTLPQNYVHIVLNKNAEAEMKRQLPNKRIEYVPHGYEVDKKKQIKPDFIKKGERFIFCPVNRNYDKELMIRLFKAQQLRDFLINNEITLYHKIKDKEDDGFKRIMRINSFLKAEEYSYMLSESLAVILPYGDEFKYRSSGIFYECVASDIPIIATKIPDLLAHKNDTNIYYFDDANSFVDCIKGLKTGGSVKTNKELFNPENYWKQTLLIE